MPRTSRHRRTAPVSSRTLLIFLLILLVAASIYLATGNDPLGIFAAPTPTATSLPTATLPAPFTIGRQNWWHVFFTDPLALNDPAVLAGTIEEKLIAWIDVAQTSIHIASFEFDLTPVADALIAARRRGVDVRWITDDEHGLESDFEEGHGQFAMLQNASIEIRDDSRSALMHHKFWIFDRRVVWTGSTNITINGIFKQDNNVIVIESPELAAIYERQWEDMWNGNFNARSPSGVEEQSVNVNGSQVQVLFSPEDGVMSYVISYIQEAQDSIRFMAFAFTDYPLADAMRTRASAGVDVSGIFERVGSDTEYAELRTLWCSGVPVRLDGNSSFMHHKLIIIDDRIVITGSLNFSTSADEDNNENVIIIENPEIAALYLHEFERVWSLASDPLDLICP